jgi:hypothetical protein
VGEGENNEAGKYNIYCPFFFFLSSLLSLLLTIMSLLLNDIHLPLLIKSTLSEHAQYKTLPWNNLDQLSSLWGGKILG